MNPERSSLNMSSLPTASIVMPVRDEADHIDAALDSVLSQDYQGELEIIVADGGSVDGTRIRVEARAEIDHRIRLIDNPDGTAPSGLNAAIEAAVGSVIVRCDGHSELDSDYVTIAVEVLAETGAANVGGVQAAEGKGLIQRAIALAMTSPLGVGNSRFHYSANAGPTDTVYLGAFDRSALEAVGGFDVSLVRNQDYEMNHRLRRSGRVVWFDPRLRVRYRPRRSLRALWRQYFDYGTWKRVMLRGAPDALKARQLAPPLLVIGLIGSVALTIVGYRTWAVPGVYMGFLVLGTISEAVRRRELAAVLLPPVLAIMHLGWGTGFLFGRTRL